MTVLFGDRSDRRTAVILLVLLAVLPLVIVEQGTSFRGRLLVMMLAYAIITMALNIVFAHTDQLFLFSGALAGVSGYTTALLAQAVGVSPWLTLPVGVLAAGLIGLVVSYVAARRGMSVIVIAILTLSLQFVAYEFFLGARDITNGSTGFSFTGLQIRALEESLGLSHELANYFVLLVVFAVALVVYSRLMHSRYGLAFDAIRQDEGGAESVGVDVIRYKSLAGFTAAALIGVVGPFLANLERYILPSMFSFQQVDVLVLIMLVIGGMRTMIGPVVGAVLVIVLNEWLRQFGQWETAIYGVLLVGLFLYFDEGIVPKARSLLGLEDAPSLLARLRERRG